MKISISAFPSPTASPRKPCVITRKRLLRRIEPPPAAFGAFPSRMQRLGIIKSLQRQGFSLDEIKRILTKCALSDLIVMMDESAPPLREQIAQQNAVYERMTSGTDLLRDCQRLLMQPRLLHELRRLSGRFRFGSRAVDGRSLKCRFSRI